MESNKNRSPRDRVIAPVSVNQKSGNEVIQMFSDISKSELLPVMKNKVASMKVGSNCDMFDINGIDKLEMKSVADRAQIIRYYMKSQNAIFFSSHSGGKDSQDMLIELLKQGVPKERIVIIHANLGKVEHRGVIEHIEKFSQGIDVHIVKNELRDFIDMVLLRGMWPSTQFRQCTSELKTGPVDKLIRAFMKEYGYTVGFNCVGIRADESRMRAMKNPLWINKRLTLKNGQRTVYDFLPIFHHTTKDVFDSIYTAGQHPHPAYGERGEKNTRLSCVLCIMSNKNDLLEGVTNYPEIYHEYAALERVIDHTMFMKKVKGESVKVYLGDKVGVPLDENVVELYMRRLSKRREYLLEQKRVMLLEKADKKANKAGLLTKKTQERRDPNTIEMFA